MVPWLFGINFVSCKQMLMGIAVRARGSGYTKQKILGLASEFECVQWDHKVTFMIMQ